jgi:choline dehydrogenase
VSVPKTINDVEPIADEEFDLIVVGAGPAGATVAARASADPDVRVLLIERGPDWRVADAPPELHSTTLISYRGIPALERFHSMDAVARKTPRDEFGLYLGGQGLGGSSLINGGIILRPPLDDYDVWAEMGATRWSGEMALELWRALESDRDFGEHPLHGSDGPLSVERIPREQWSTLDNAFWEASVAAGYEVVEDLNGAYADGIGPLPFGRRNGNRETANHVFLDPVRDRGNLTILGDTLVDRLVLDRSGSRVTGVIALVDGRAEQIAGRRVVCSAGTIGTAGILLRSGIGPADELGPLGIAVHHDLPVGRRVQDHMQFSVAADWTLPEDPNNLKQSWTSSAIRYSSGLVGAPPGDMLITPIGPLEVLGMKLAPAVSVWVLETYSWGSLRLRSTDPTVYPDVCIGLYDDERDLVRMRDGARRITALLDSPPFDGIRGTQRRCGFAGVELADMQDDAAVDAMLKAATDLHVHISSCAPMGPADSETAVVDEQARVFGVDGLWLADLSICPKVARANTWATAMLIGQFVADLVVSDLGSARAVATGAA